MQYRLGERYDPAERAMELELSPARARRGAAHQPPAALAAAPAIYAGAGCARSRAWSGSRRLSRRRTGARNRHHRGKPRGRGARPSRPRAHPAPRWRKPRRPISICMAAPGRWVAPHVDDPLNVRMVRTTGRTVVSVDYRLVPAVTIEDVIDDCETAAAWGAGDAGWAGDHRRRIRRRASGGMHAAAAARPRPGRTHRCGRAALWHLRSRRYAEPTRRRSRYAGVRWSDGGV